MTEVPKKKASGLMENRSGAPPPISIQEMSEIQAEARILSLLTTHSRRVAAPIELVKSGVPRVCIPLEFGRSGGGGGGGGGGDAGARISIRTWSDSFNDSSLSNTQRARLALAVCLLVTPVGADLAGTRQGDFDSAFSWLISGGGDGGGESAKKKFRNIQKEALKLLGLDARLVRRGEQKMSDSVLSFLDVTSGELWLFMMDGRVNLNETLKRAAQKIASSPQESRPLLVDSCKRFLSSPMKLLRDCGGTGQNAMAPWDQQSQRTFAEELLLRFEPTTARRAAMLLRDGHEFISISVPRKHSHVLANWPIPRDLRAHLKKKLQYLESTVASSGFLEGVKASTNQALMAYDEDYGAENGIEHVTCSADDDDDDDDDSGGSAAAAAGQGHNVADRMPRSSDFQQEEGVDIVTYEAGKRKDGTMVGMTRGVVSVAHLQKLRNEAIEREAARSESSAAAEAEDLAGSSDRRRAAFDASVPIDENPDFDEYGFPADAVDEGRGAFVDEFGDELGAAGSSAKGSGGDPKGDDAEVDKGSLSMFQGVHMIEEFKRRSIFQRFRDDFAAERLRVAKAHPQGTADYNEAMGNLKDTHLEKFVHAFFTSNTMPRAIYGMREWWVKKDTTQMPEILLEVNDKTPFCNFMLRRYMDIDLAYQPGRQMEPTMLCHIASPAGFCHVMRMRPAILLLGPASTGKSYAMDVAKKLMPPGTTAEIVYSTTKSSMSGTDETDCCVIEQEVSRDKLGVDAHGNSIAVDPWIKNMFTNQILTTRYMEHRTDPETGAVVREDKMCVKRYERSFLGASNDPVTGNEDAMIKRFILYTIHATTEEDSRITTLMNKPEWTKPIGATKQITEKYQSLYALVAFAEKAIESNAISEPNMDAMCEMKEMLEYVQNTYGMATDDPKSFDKMTALCRLLTIQYAVYAAVCSENGRHFRFFEDTGEPRRLEKDFKLAAEVLKEIESYAVCTREIVVYVFSLLRSEWMDETYQRVFDAVRAMYLGKKSGSVTSAEFSERQCQFGGPIQSRLYNDLGYDPKDIRDATYLMIKPEGAGVSYRSVAASLVNAIPGDRIPVDDLQKILRRMSQTRVTGDVHIIEPGSYRKNDRPSVCTDRETGDRIRHSFAMVTCQPVKRHSGPIPYCDSEEARVEAAAGDDNDHHRFRNENGEGRRMWFGIAYDLVYERRCSKSIVEAAISALAHHYQLGDVQTFVTSLPVEHEVIRPASISRRRHGAESTTEVATFHQLPSLYDMHAVLRMRFINNPQPILDYLKVHLACNETGPMADSAKRRSMIESASSPMMFVNVEPDMVALISHHSKCGIERDDDKHPTRLLKVMLEIRRRVMPHLPFNDYKMAVRQLVSNWNHKRETKVLGGHIFKTAAELEHTRRALGSSVGMMSDTIFANRLLTDTDLQMGNDADEFRRNHLSSNSLFQSMIEGNEDLKRRMGLSASALAIRDAGSTMQLSRKRSRISSSCSGGGGGDEGIGAALRDASLPAPPPPPLGRSSSAGLLTSDLSNSAIAAQASTASLMDKGFQHNDESRYSAMTEITKCLGQRFDRNANALDAAGDEDLLLRSSSAAKRSRRSGGDDAGAANSADGSVLPGDDDDDDDDDDAGFDFSLSSKRHPKTAAAAAARGSNEAADAHAEQSECMSDLFQKQDDSKSITSKSRRSASKQKQQTPSLFSAVIGSAKNYIKDVDLDADASFN